MKKLISEKIIEKAISEGRMRIEFSFADTIVTPQAQSLAEKKGVELINKEARQVISHADMQRIVSEIQKKLPGGKFSQARIQKAIKDVLNLGNVS